MVRAQRVQDGSKRKCQSCLIKHFFLAERIAALFRVFAVDKVAFISTSKVFFYASNEYWLPSDLSFATVSCKQGIFPALIWPWLFAFWWTNQKCCNCDYLVPHCISTFSHIFIFKPPIPTKLGWIVRFKCLY